MKKILAILTLGLCFVFVANAQQTRHICGTTTADQLQYEARLDANIAASKNKTQASDRSAIQYVPIHFHLVGDANGDGKIKERFVLDQLCSLNDAYAPMDIRFYLKPHPTYGLFDYSINNNNVYNNQNNEILMKSRRNQNALNVYIVEATISAEVAAYYSIPNDWVVSRKSYTNGDDNNATLPHEIGHFFSLWHTFLGFEVNSFTTTSPGWPIAPVISPYDGLGTIYTEYQDASNCATAADKICDTPPDYNFGSLVSNCATYTAGAKDPGGTLVNPMENNYMGYFFECNYLFTPGQQSAILADRETGDRNYLDNNFTPAATEITTPPTDQFLVSPASGETVPYFDEVLLEWNAVPGATYYLLEMDYLSTYNTANFRSFIVSGTSKLFTDLDDNRQYFWRVRPFNEYVTCAQARQRSFKTSTVSGVKEIEALSALMVAPNPVSGDAAVRLFVNATENFEASVLILDATGRQVRSLSGTKFSAGETTLDLPTTGLANGLYFVAIENATGRAVRKMTILR
ncbi:MAG TPA: T9SS type A sorting domain-containing protein [Saprospiraceae bacterium]|nr:T9SS type A sorting domain-containing protein [Saprospiraceae bacterium]